MGETPKNPLDYAAPGTAQDWEPADPTIGGTSAVQFVFGLILGVGGGTLMSYCAYRWGWRAWPAAVLLLLSGKLGVGVGLLNRRGKRGIGIGLLLSILLGVLIFLGECGARFKNM
jgi:hypothetical protein